MNPFSATYKIENVNTGRFVAVITFQVTPEELFDAATGQTDYKLRALLKDFGQSHFNNNYLLSPADGASFISWARAAIAEQERMEDASQSALTAAQRNPTMEAQ